MNRVIKLLLAVVGLLGVTLLVFSIGPFLSFRAGCTSDHVMTQFDNVSGDTDAEVREARKDLEDYTRQEEGTFLTFPEWYIVYSADEYAAFLEDNRPSQFPYFAAINQFWRTYGCMYETTKEEYPFNDDTHLMLRVIGVSFSVEYAVKGIYENTTGRMTEWLSRHKMVEEDVYAQEVAKEYGEFLHTIPWYEFPFGQKLTGLWVETKWWGAHPIRKWERKLILSLEYAGKGIYGAIIRKATAAVFEPAELEIMLFAETVPAKILEKEPRIEVVQTITDKVQLVKMPRYEAFTGIVTMLARENVQFVEIAGNKDILITAIAPVEWSHSAQHSEILFALDMLTQPDLQRVALRVSVPFLHEVIRDLEQQGVKIEHVYDY